MIKFINNLTLTNFLIISIWVSFFSSINLNPEKLFEYNIVNIIRIILPLLLVVIASYIKFEKIKLFEFKGYLNILFYIIFVSYFFFTITNKLNNSLNLFWPFYMMLSLYVLRIFYKIEELEIIYKTTIFVIFVGFFFYFLSALFQMYTTETYHFYGVMGTSLDYAGLENPPRSSGLSRLALILLSFTTIYYIFNKKKGDYKFLLLITLLGFVTLVFQSRTVSFIYFIVILTFIIFFFKRFFFDKLVIIFILLLPLLLNFTYNYVYLLHKIKLEKIAYVDDPVALGNTMQRSKDLVFYSFKDSIIRDQLSERKNKFLNEQKINRFSSNRFANWSLAYKIIRQNYFVGYGAQADRIYIKQSIHNSLIYSLLAGGIYSGIAIILIYLYSIFLIFKLYFSKISSHKENYLEIFSCFVLIILGLRSILETSFAVFSIDYLIFIIALIYLQKKISLD